jgi:2-polyprenyl-6-methoxyphenol hydroxylase-like FAD-dependent oxidoreductase
LTDVAASPDGVRLRLKDGTSHDFGILVAADGPASSVRNVVFPEYPKPHFTGLIGTGGITDPPVPDTGGVMRMTFGNDAFFGYLKAKGQPIHWFNS